MLLNARGGEGRKKQKRCIHTNPFPQIYVVMQKSGENSNMLDRQGRDEGLRTEIGVPFLLVFSISTKRSPISRGSADEKRKRREASLPNDQKPLLDE